MKTFFSILALFTLFSTSLFSQTQGHPTISKLQATYKVISGPANPVTGDIKVQSTANIILKNAATVTKIYLKIIDKQTGIVVYDVNYLLSLTPLTDVNGMVLLKKESNVVQIGNPATVSLKSYIYEVNTEDFQGTKSITYSITQ